jgi:hypothetical protein
MESIDSTIREFGAFVQTGNEPIIVIVLAPWFRGFSGFRGSHGFSWFFGSAVRVPGFGGTRGTGTSGTQGTR